MSTIPPAPPLPESVWCCCGSKTHYRRGEWIATRFTCKKCGVISEAPPPQTKKFFDKYGPCFGPYLETGLYTSCRFCNVAVFYPHYDREFGMWKRAMDGDLTVGISDDIMNEFEKYWGTMHPMRRSQKVQI